MRQSRSQKRKNKSYTPAKPEIWEIHPKTENQALLSRSIHENMITIASGEAGVGKTLIALYEGAKSLSWNKYDQIIYIKSINDFKGQKSIGFLPGDLNEKIQPLLAPVRDNMRVFMHEGKAEEWLRKGKVEFQLVEYLRGRSFRDKYVILDEAQNFDKHGLLTVISRMEESSKLIILGDPMQSDIKNQSVDGLTDCINRMESASYVGYVPFTGKDCQRSIYAQDIHRRYK